MSEGRVSGLRVRPKSFVRLALKKEKPEFSSRLFVKFDPHCALAVTRQTVNGSNRILGRGCGRGRVRAIDYGIRTGRGTHNKPAADTQPRRVARRPAGLRRPVADNTVPDG